MRPRLLLFTKPAVPGRVKTRLIGALDAERAAEVHRAFVADLAGRLRRSPAFELEVAWALEPGEAPPDWPELADLRWQRQSDGDLGARLFAGLSGGAEHGAGVAAVGSDHPELSAARIEAAFEHLRQGKDLALGPASDGGYYLIAARPGALHRRLFEQIRWSTSGVFRQTLERAHELSLSVAELPVEHDVDHPEDLRDLARRLASAPAADCPRTRGLLEQWGLLAAGTVAHR